jgi:uncharacterized protein (TIGR02271 family)
LRSPASGGACATFVAQVRFQQPRSQEGTTMKYVFGLFDNESSATAATKRVEGHAQVRRVGTTENIHSFGLGPKEERDFTDGLRRGGVLLAAKVDDRSADLVAREFQMEPVATAPVAGTTSGTTGATGLRAKAHELKEAAAAKLSGTEERIKEKIATRGEHFAEERAVPVIEEKIEVGKRAVDRGAIRVISHVVTKPFDESVWLHEEEVDVERRTIRRDLRTGEEIGEATIEVRARGEEPVVSKHAEVVGEVVLRKRDYEREAKIHDTVKRTEVEVQRDKARVSRPSSESRPSIR